MREPADTGKTEDVRAIEHALDERFGTSIRVDPEQAGASALARLLEHRSHRRYAPRPVAADLLQLLFACALSSPSKSDLQQADIVHVADPTKRSAIADLIPDMPWVKHAPVFLVFCGNNRRIRQIAELRGKPFANDHVDAFMNAAVDAGIVMTSFIHAAQAAGLGCCPISAVRNHAQAVSDLLALPDWVFPVAGLCVGYPADAGIITARLPLSVTVHTDRFDETGIAAKIDGYDRRRAARQRYSQQRGVELYGESAFYGWSEDKARQYSFSERADFGAFLNRKKFKLT